jgi:hypothetical protein
MPIERANMHSVCLYYDLYGSRGQKIKILINSSFQVAHTLEQDQSLAWNPHLPGAVPHRKFPAGELKQSPQVSHR